MPFLLDLRSALRGLLKAPGFTLTALLTLALGVGANTAMFSAIHALLLKPLPYPQPTRLVALYSCAPSQGRQRGSLSNLDFLDYRDEATKSFEGMASYADGSADLAGEGRPERVATGQVTAGFFELLGARPAAGSFFTRDNETVGRDKAVVLSFGLWQRRFGGDPGVVGRTVRLGGEGYSVLGVAPRGFSFPMRRVAELYTPIAKEPDPANRGAHRYSAFGRLRSGVTPAAAEAEMKSVAAGLARSYTMDAKYSAQLFDLHTDLVGEQGKPLILLMGAVALLLLIACTNVANLFLARALARSREVAIRASLGAGRAQLFSQFLAEGLVMGLSGSLLGLALAKAMVLALPALLPDVGRIQTLQSFGLDGATLAYTLGVALATSVFFGLVPALQAGRGDLNQVLREGAKGSAAGSRLRSGLVVGEIALAMVLLISSGLLLRSFLRVLGTDSGFQPKGVLAFTVGLPESRYKTDSQVRSFATELQRRVAALPGVSSVGYSWLPPMSPVGATTSFGIQPTSTPENEWPGAEIDLAGPGYFETLRAPLLRGRALGAGDTENSARVVVISESMAKQYFAGREPVGQRMRIGFAGDTSDDKTLWEIVGVVGDLRYHGLEKAARPRMILPFSQMPIGQLSLELRSSASAPAMASLLQEQLRGMDPDLAAGELRDLSESARELMGDRRQVLLLLGSFAALALLLAGIGIHGIVSYGVAQRRREIGIRMALGGQVRDVLRLVMGQGLRLAGAGVLIGALASLASGRFLASQLAGLQAADPATLLGVALLLCGVAAMASFIPALRAAKTDPMIALRSE